MALLSGVVKVVADQVRADFCLLYLLNAETDHLELKVVNERGAEVSHFSRLIPQEALRSALLSSHAAAWEPPQLFPAEMLIGPGVFALGDPSYHHGGQGAGVGDYGAGAGFDAFY
jgi:hypothetical protein